MHAFTHTHISKDATRLSNNSCNSCNTLSFESPLMSRDGLTPFCETFECSSIRVPILDCAILMTGCFGCLKRRFAYYPRRLHRFLQLGQLSENSFLQAVEGVSTSWPKSEKTVLGCNKVFLKNYKIKQGWASNDTSLILR